MKVYGHGGIWGELEIKNVKNRWIGGCFPSRGRSGVDHGPGFLLEGGSVILSVSSRASSKGLKPLFSSVFKTTLLACKHWSELEVYVCLRTVEVFAARTISVGHGIPTGFLSHLHPYPLNPTPIAKGMGFLLIWVLGSAGLMGHQTCMGYT